ncbi:uncharacterized protein TNCV_2923631 [Trichonephila clavipes]|nr:uncharacterized protein TNCV_2923631 [Trichonephila clavipes]
MAKSRSGRSKKRRFTGNRYTIRSTINENDETSELNSTESASAKSWNQAIQGLELIEDSVSGLCSHMNLKCKNCSFFKGFPTTEKMKGSCLINSSIVLRLKIIGKGFSAGKKLCAFLGLPFLSKLAFCNQERKLLKATERVAQENINAALSEIKGSNSFTKCGISIDGTWQTQRLLIFEWVCSAVSMEVVGAYRIFERSNVRNVQYNEYYGDWDSKGYESVKNFYGINTVTKLECIGHVQKRVGGRLRQLKKKRRKCPEGSESWCRYQRAKAAGSPFKEIEQGLPNKIINQIKPTYLKLCNETLLKKCLHALILYNSGYAGILSVIRNVNGSLPESVAQELLKFDKQRISTSLRHSLPIAKLSRKRKAARKTKSTKDEKQKA